jgi:hypothetical protein
MKVQTYSWNLKNNKNKRKTKSGHWAKFSLEWATRPSTSRARPWRVGDTGGEAPRCGHHDGGETTASPFCASGALDAHHKWASGGGVFWAVKGADEGVVPVTGGYLLMSLQLHARRGST